MKMHNKLESVKAAFQSNGITIAEWSRANGFDEKTVYAVLLGRNKAGRGEGHRVAVALGLKEESANLELSARLSTKGDNNMEKMIRKK